MAADTTTFVLAFAAVYGALTVYLASLDRRIRNLERRLVTEPGRHKREEHKAS